MPRSARGLLAGLFDGLVQAKLKQFQRGQFRQIFADANRLGIQLEQFYLFRIGGSTQNQSEWGVLSRSTFIFVEPAQVELHLPDMSWLERLQLQFHGDQPAQEAMVEQ